MEDVNSEMEQLEREEGRRTMKLTQMIEKFAKQGMLNGVARAELLQAAEETEQEMAELQEENEAENQGFFSGNQPR